MSNGWEMDLILKILNATLVFKKRLVWMKVLMGAEIVCMR